MKSRLTRRVAIIAGTTILALGGATYAVAHGVGGGEKEREAFLDDAAQRLNVTPEELTKALKEAAAARIDQARADGRVTQEQADEMKRRLEESDWLPFLGPPRVVHLHRVGPPPGMEAAARYLGLSEAELREQLMDGRSLAEVAEARNKSVDGLREAMERAIRADVEKAVDEGGLTRRQADRILEHLDGRIDEKIERAGRPRGPHGRGGPGGPGGPGFGPLPGLVPAPEFGPLPGFVPAPADPPEGPDRGEQRDDG
jgi:hypothetical protein